MRMVCPMVHTKDVEQRSRWIQRPAGLIRGKEWFSGDGWWPKKLRLPVVFCPPDFRYFSSSWWIPHPRLTVHLAHHFLTDPVRKGPEVRGYCLWQTRSSRLKSWKTKPYLLLTLETGRYPLFWWSRCLGGSALPSINQHGWILRRALWSWFHDS